MVLFFPPFPLSPLPAPRVSALLFGRWEESDGDFPGKGGLGWDGMGWWKIPPARWLPGWECWRIHGSVEHGWPRAARQDEELERAGSRGHGFIFWGGGRSWNSRGNGVQREPSVFFFPCTLYRRVYLTTAGGSCFRSLWNSGRDGSPHGSRPCGGGHKPGEFLPAGFFFPKFCVNAASKNSGSIGFVLPVGNRAVSGFSPAFFPQFSQFIPAEINRAPNPYVEFPSCHFPPQQMPWNFLGKRNGWDGWRFIRMVGTESLLMEWDEHSCPRWGFPKNGWKG